MTQAVETLSPTLYRFGKLDKRLRLLFLACYFPPVQASGWVRAWSIAKHLNRLGWQETVVTSHPSV